MSVQAICRHCDNTGIAWDTHNYCRCAMGRALAKLGMPSMENLTMSKPQSATGDEQCCVHGVHTREECPKCERLTESPSVSETANETCFLCMFPGCNGIAETIPTGQTIPAGATGRRHLYCPEHRARRELHEQTRDEREALSDKRLAEIRATLSDEEGMGSIAERLVSEWAFVRFNAQVGQAALDLLADNDRLRRLERIEPHVVMRNIDVLRLDERVRVMEETAQRQLAESTQLIDRLRAELELANAKARIAGLIVQKALTKYGQAMTIVRAVANAVIPYTTLGEDAIGAIPGSVVKQARALLASDATPADAGEATDGWCAQCHRVESSKHVREHEAAAQIAMSQTITALTASGQFQEADSGEKE